MTFGTTLVIHLHCIFTFYKVYAALIVFISPVAVHNQENSLHVKAAHKNTLGKQE
jgi:hypothetical protein